MNGSTTERTNQSKSESDPLSTIVLMGMVLGGAAAFDYWAELGVAAGVPYVALVCLAYFAPSQRWIWFSAFVGIAMTGIGFWWSAPGGELWKVIANRILAIFAIVVVAWFANLARRQKEILRGHTTTLHREVVVKSDQLNQSETQFRKAFESSPNGLLVVDRQGTIEMANHQTVSLFGYPVKELLQQSLKNLIPSRYHSNDLVGEGIPSENNGETEHSFCCEIQGKRQSGAEFPMEIQLTSISESSNKTMVTVSDISERVRNERMLREQSNRLARLNTELLEFAYSASHDLKAPLASIRGLLAICENDLREGDLEEVIANLGKSNALAERLSQRVEAALTLAKSDMQSSDVRPISVPVHIEKAWEAIPHDGVSLQLKFCHQDPIYCLPTRFDAVIENLLSNAVKYQHPDEPQKTVALTTWNRDKKLCFSVSDNGVGIPKDQQKKIFRIYHRLAGDSIPGSGLGLAIVKRHLVQLGGSIDVESSPGATVFTVTLPEMNIEQHEGGPI